MYEIFLSFVFIKISRTKLNGGQFEGIFDALCKKMSMLFLTKGNEFHLYIRKILKNTKRYFSQHSFDLKIITVNHLFRMHIKTSLFRNKKKFTKYFVKFLQLWSKF